MGTDGSSALDNSSAWDSGEKSGLVDIGTHSLQLYARGKDRKPGSPAAILIPGLGSSITGWAAVQRFLAPIIRVFSYDRTGYGHSETDSKPPTSTRIARELDLLLSAAQIASPFIIVAHSWGGVLSREFLELRRDVVVGILFVEANQEHTLEVLDWRKLSNSPVLVGVNRNDSTGLLQSQQLTDGEWKTLQDTEATTKHQQQAALEFEQYAESFPTLATKHQLQRDPPLIGNYPVCVIRGDNGRDFELLYAAGVALGNGNETERAEFRDAVETWSMKDSALQSGNLKLSDKNRYFEVPRAGHNVQLTAPKSIVEGVMWILDQLKASNRSLEPK